jgi:aspartate-semialdehyde dehydrogenase
VGHSEALNIEFENEISAEEAQNILREAPGVMLIATTSRPEPMMIWRTASTTPMWWSG